MHYASVLIFSIFMETLSIKTVEAISVLTDIPSEIVREGKGNLKRYYTT